MFWGLNLKPNRKYTQTTSKPFHISLASLDTDSVSDGGSNQIFINHDNQKFLICTLRQGTCEQVMLDLNFGEGDEICFQCIGSGNVSLTGYLIDKFNFMDDESDGEEESEAEEVQDLRQALNKKSNAKKDNVKKQAASNEEEDDDDEDDSDFNGEGLDEVEDEEDGDDDDEDDDGVEEDEDDDDEDEDEDESEEEEMQQPKAKQPKLDKPQKQQNGITAKENEESKGKKNKKDKKDKKANKNEQQPQKQQQQKAGGERVITGGVKIEDIRVGNGPEAKPGKRAQVFYEGRLKSNNKVFDSLKTGAGFKFALGRGEVIKGWDVGLVGMKVGGKRRITCPPHMAYGARGSPPTIPPNSTLVFEVELKGVH